MIRMQHLSVTADDGARSEGAEAGLQADWPWRVMPDASSIAEHSERLA